jgi:hypothetical protein
MEIRVLAQVASLPHNGIDTTLVSRTRSHSLTFWPRKR